MVLVGERDRYTLVADVALFFSRNQFVLFAAASNVSPIPNCLTLSSCREMVQKLKIVGDRGQPCGSPSHCILSWKSWILEPVPRVPSNLVAI